MWAHSWVDSSCLMPPAAIVLPCCAAKHRARQGTGAHHATQPPPQPHPTPALAPPAWLMTSAAVRRCSASEGAKSKYSTASPLCRRAARLLGGSRRRGV